MCIQLRLLCSIPFGECLYTVRVNTPLTTVFRLVSSRKTIRCFILCHRLLIRRLDIFVTGLALYTPFSHVSHASQMWIVNFP